MKSLLEKRKMQLKGGIFFNAQIFLQKVKERVNLKYFRPSAEKTTDAKISEAFPASTYTEYLAFVRDRLHVVESEPWALAGLSALFYDLDKWSAFLKVGPVLTYECRPLTKLSVGQKGTVYLCLKLATQAFSQPLIFDQPEDDLDNEFIIQDLVGIFRGIKKFRQVILVTHNANIVVNSDSEQVIVAQNIDGRLHYVSGALEDPTTNQSVRQILEGGDQAFLRREKRYHIKPKHLPGSLTAS